MTDENAERKEKIQQLLTGFLKLKTEREYQRTSLNETKIDIQWRELFREAKTKELQDDLKHMKESFIKAVDFKDAIIDNLQKEIEQTEVQNMWTACNHMQSLEKLIAFEKQKSEELREKYENDLNELRKFYSESKEEIEKKFTEDMSWFKDLHFIEKTVFEDYSDISKRQFVSLQVAIDDELFKEKTGLLITFDSHISEIWKQFQHSLVKYMEDADVMEKLFAEIKEEYEASMIDFQQDLNTAEELKRSIPQLKAQIKERKKDHEERIQKIKNDHEGFYTDAGALKKRISKVQQHDRESLTNLIINSGNVLHELRELSEKGQRILKLHERCKKFEAEIDQIAESDSDSSSDEMDNDSDDVKFSLPHLQLGEACEYVGLLEKFWIKHSKVNLKNLALERELDDLQFLNRQLKSDMSRFLKNVADGKTEKLMRKPFKKPVIQEAAILAKNFPESEIESQI